MKINRIKVIGYSGVIALLASMIIGLLGFSTSTQQIQTIKNTLLTTHLTNNVNLSMKYLLNSYGSLTPGEGTLLDEDGQSIEGTTDVVDSVLADLGNKSTIFVKEGNDFRRVATNIMSDETRAIGTYLGADHNAYENVMNGQVYVGEANILGENYYAAYDPIKDPNGNVIGMLFVGVPTTELDNLINAHEEEMSSINILIILLRAFSFGTLIALVAVSLISKEKGKSSKDGGSDRPADGMSSTTAL